MFAALSIFELLSTFISISASQVIGRGNFDRVKQIVQVEQGKEQETKSAHRASFDRESSISSIKPFQSSVRDY